MAKLRTAILVVTALLFTAPAAGQLSLPDALQGNPLEDKTIGKTPENPFAAIHSFAMEGTIRDAVTGVEATTSGHLRLVDGYTGNALHFDGTSYAVVPIDVSALGLPNMTIAMMVRPDTIPEDPDELAGVPSSGYIFSDGDSFIILNNQKKTSAFLSAFSAKASVHDSVTFQVPHGGWHLVAMSRAIEKRTNDEGRMTDHTILKLYVNGRLVEEVAEVGDAAVDLRATAPEFTLGTYGNVSQRFRGAIDQVAVFAYAFDRAGFDELRDRWRQTAGNEYFFGSRDPAQQVDAGPDDGSVAEDADPGEQQPYTPFDGPDVDAPDLAADVDPKLAFSGDWAIRRFDRIDRHELGPGSTFQVVVDIEKDDPQGNFPSAGLRVGSQPPRLISATGKHYLTLQVPGPVAMQSQATGSEFTIVAQLRAPGGGSLDDYHPSNNSARLRVPVGMQDAPPEPVGAADAGDTPAEDVALPYSYPDVALLSEISGAEGNEVWTLYRHSDQDVVTAIEIREKRLTNKPCSIGVSGSSTFFMQDESCEMSSPAAPQFDTGGDPITALQVCHAALNNRIKGVRVWRQSLQADGRYDGFRPYELSTAERLFERASCSSWRERVYCDRDAVATGIRAHVSANDAIVGLQLMCAQVRPN